MFRLRVLGGFALEGPTGTAVPPPPRRRAEAVLAVLAVCGDVGCTRERLVALLWPESDEVQSRHGLRDALHAIRRALGPNAVPSGAQLLRLHPSVVASDVASFRQALDAGRHADAVRAYGGPLLEGFHVDDAAEFEHWLDGERTRLARGYVEALKQLATAAEGVGAWDEAAGWWARAVEHDPLNSHLVLQHLHALAAIGDRANAIKAADAHGRRLRDELDLEPDREILAKIDRIRRGDLPLQGSMPRPPSAALANPPAPEEEPQPLEKSPRVEKQPRRWAPWAAGVATVVLLAGVLGARRWLRPEVTDARPPRTAIAVLPFLNQSADSSNGYFAAGLHDELLTQLTRVASLKVVGRQSVGGYHEASKPLRLIGEELGVGSIVEGSVQVVGNRLRVTVQLLDVLTQVALWAQSYDRTVDSALAVQTDIAQQIVTAVGATVTSAEAGAIAAAPTQNAEAYQFYLQGLEYQRRPGLLRRNFETARQLYERAVALDSAFAPAHAALSRVHSAMHAFGYDQSPARGELARREADVSLRLAPDLPEAHLAAGIIRYGARRDYRAAVDEFHLGLRSAPNDPELWAWIGRAQRRLGNWDSMLVAFDHARRLDPRNANLFQAIGDTYHRLHRYQEAIEAYRHAQVLAPDLIQPHLSLAWSYILWKGDLDTLRAVLRGVPLDAEAGMAGGLVGGNLLTLLLLERRPDSLLSVLRAIHPLAPSRAISQFRAYWSAQALMLRGDTAAARTTSDSAAVWLDADERAHPDDGEVHAARGLVLAWLGRRAEALREARWLAQSDAYRNDRYEDVGWGRARILMLAGETDEALAEVERMLAGPSTVTVPLLRLDPAWDPIRSDPRFQALLVKYANPGIPR